MTNSCDGRTANGKQRDWCKACQRSSRAKPQPNEYLPAQQEQILRAYEERSSLCGLERTFGVSRFTVNAWTKKSSPAPAPERDLIACRADCATALLWSFVQKKANKRWSCAARHAKSSPTSSARAVRQLVNNCGRASQRLIARDTVARTGVGSLAKSHSARAAHGVRQGDRTNESRRTMEQYVAPTLGTLCQNDIILFQIRGNARSLFALVPSALQSFFASFLIYPLPKIYMRVSAGWGKCLTLSYSKKSSRRHRNGSSHFRCVYI